MSLEPRAVFPLLAHDSRIYTDKVLRNYLWHLHGLLLTTAFLLLFPLGVVAIRSGARYAFRYHWLLQISASILALTGIAVGLVTSKGLVLWHQYLGLVLGFVLLLQPISGWRHHVGWVNQKRKSWVSGVHVWAGRIGIGLAWVNILNGLVLRRYHFLVQAGAGVAMLCLVVLWMLWGLGVLEPSAKGSFQKVHDTEDREGLMTGVGNEFALDDLEEEDEEDNDNEHDQRQKPRT